MSFPETACGVSRGDLRRRWAVVHKRMTRDELLAYKQRWQLVQAREVEELRAASPEHKLRQVAALMASVDAMGWRDGLADDLSVWQTWQRLRERLGRR